MPMVGGPVPFRPPEATAPAVPAAPDPTPTRVAPSLLSRVVAYVREFFSTLFNPNPQPQPA